MNPLVRVLRFILSPIADSKWKHKFNERRMRTCLTPLGFMDMPPDGRLNLGGGVFAPIEFHDDGKVRIGDHIFHKTTNFGMELDSNWVITRTGELVTITKDKVPQHFLTFEEGGWQQWGYKHPSLRDALVVEFHANRELGARAVYAVFIFSLMAFFGLFVLTFLFSYFGLTD